MVFLLSSRKKKNKCSKCGNTDLGAPYKTWNLFSPIPDKHGNITITVMGMYNCGCGNKVRGVVTKMKTDAKKAEEEGLSRRQRLINACISQKKVSLAEVASELGTSVDVVEKVVLGLIGKSELRGKIEEGFFIND